MLKARSISLGFFVSCVMQVRLFCVPFINRPQFSSNTSTISYFFKLEDELSTSVRWATTLTL